MGLLVAAIRIYMMVIFVRAIFSWLPPRSRANEVYEFIFGITEPVLRPVRRILPPMGGVDLSPLVVLFGLMFLAQVLAAV